MQVTTRTDLSAKSRTPLSRERVLRAALVLADRDGIESLSMRKLGQELHVAVIGSLRAAGFTIEMAAHAFSVLDGYIYGFALQQINLPYHTSQEGAAVAEHLLRQLLAEEYPHLAEMLVEYALKPDYDYAKELEIGLNLILDALHRLRGTA